jgi:hypothetical protein
MIIKPQIVQEKFLTTPADVALFGGSAGGGKTFASLIDHMRWKDIENYQGLIVRKSYQQIFSAGGLWDEAKKIYPMFGGVPFKTPIPRFVFPSGAQVTFKHSGRVEDVELNFQGIQADVITIDEAANGFTLREILYIQSRLRSMTKLNAYMRMTCNPNANSFLRKMVDWYLLPDETPDFSKSGILRYYLMINGEFVWADHPQELIEKYNRNPLSFTFIPATLTDNPALLEKEPLYKEKLENLSEQDVLALLKGSWAVVDNPLSLFKQSDINKNRVSKFDHTQAVRIVVAIDPAGSHNKNSDDTGIVVVAMDANNICYVLEDATGKYTPEQWAEKAINLYDKYQADCIVAEKNYGGEMVENTIRSKARILGKEIKPKLVNASRGKAVRAEPVSLLYASGEVKHVGYELMELEKEMCNWIPNDPTMKSPNRLDALVWGVTELCITKKRRVRAIVV